LVILLVKLTTVVLHHRGRTDFSKAQTATVVGIMTINILSIVASRPMEPPAVRRSRSNMSLQGAGETPERVR
jgi:hypothetical protein